MQMRPIFGFHREISYWFSFTHFASEDWRQKMASLPTVLAEAASHPQFRRHPKPLRQVFGWPVPLVDDIGPSQEAKLWK